MTFSKEEKQIWGNSEVMRELERIATTQSLEAPYEAFLPIKEGQDWEDERSDEEKLMDALEDFEEEERSIEEQREVEVEFDEEKIMPVPEHEVELSDESGGSTLDPEDDDYLDQAEFEAAMNKKIESNLVSGLTKLASYLGNQGRVVEASKIEDTIRDIRLTLREAKNG